MRYYRGKRTDTGEWVFGSLIVWPDGEMDLCCEEADIKCELAKVAIRSKTAGQFTGIYTMEEIEGGDTRCTFIYEGDIVEAVLMDGIHRGFSWGRHVVVFDRGAFCLKSRRGEITPMCNYSANVKFKVLGNIHDQPELLEVSE
jgi:hypothetical protein